MKKTFYRTASFMCLAALMAFASCQKDQDVKTLFTGTIEQATYLGKTSVEIESATEDAVVKWEAGDEIAVYDPSTAHTLVATPTGDYTTADFSGIADLSDGPYYAIYPARIATSATSITLSTEQTYSNGTHFTAPMYAYSSGSRDLLFKNLCGALQLNLGDMEKTITSIELTTPHNNITGTFAIDYNGGDPEMTCTANGGHTVTLNCGESGMSCANGLTFYIYLPEGEYSAMTFTINANDDSYAVKSFEDADDPIVIERSVYYPTTFSSLNFILPAKLVNGVTFMQKIPRNATSVVFEYRSSVSSGQTLSTPDSPTPIYGNMVGSVWTVSTPAARIDANSSCIRMFNRKSNLTQIVFGSGFNTANVTDMSAMFIDCSSLTSVDVSMFNTSNISQTSTDGMTNMFNGCSSLTSLDLSSFTNGTVLSVEGMFSGCTNLETITFSSSFASTYVQYMREMFNGCSSLRSIDLSHFNTANVSSMYGVFKSCSSLTSLDLSNFNTANVNSMRSMFEGCTNLATLTLSSYFTTTNVTDMGYMFKGCEELTSIDLSHCYTPNLEWTDFMFDGCAKLSNLNISQLYLGNLEEMVGISMMFGGAGSTSGHIDITCTQATKDAIENSSEAFLMTPVTWHIVSGSSK